MFALTTLRHLFDGPAVTPAGIHAADRLQDHRREMRPASVSQFVDGWYNPYVDTLARTPWK